MTNVSHIGIAGPIACEELRELLYDPRQTLPSGYGGAPLMSVLIKEFLRSGLQVTAFTTSSDLPPDHVFRAAGAGLELRVIPARPRAWRPNGLRPGRIVDAFLRERRLLSREMRQSGAEVVHAHWAYEFALAALESGLPTLVTCHDSSREVLRHTRSPYRLIRHMMARRVLANAKHVTAVSPYLQSINRDAVRGDIRVVPNPVAPYALAAARRRGVPATRRIAMVSNGWDRLKNPEVGLRAFARYKRETPQAQLHLFGQAFPTGEHGFAWAHANNLADGVHFHGPLPHRELVRQLQDMDLLLHTALEESFGVIVAEAMALGLPVVAGIASGAVPWVVGYQKCMAGSSLLCDVNCVESVLLKIKHAFDAGYPCRSAAGIERVLERFSSTRVASEYLMCYSSIVRGAGVLPAAGASGYFGD